MRPPRSLAHAEWADCPYCTAAKKTLKNDDAVVLELDEVRPPPARRIALIAQMEDGDDIQNYLQQVRSSACPETRGARRLA